MSLHSRRSRTVACSSLQHVCGIPTYLYSQMKADLEYFCSSISLLQKHLSQDMKAEGHHHELASVFPYSAAAAAVSATSAAKSSPRNCLAAATAASSSDKASGSKASSGRLIGALRIGGAAPRGSSKHSDDSPAVSAAPPTPAGPPPTLPDGVPPAKSEPAHAEVAPAAGMSLAVLHTLQVVKDLYLIPSTLRWGRFYSSSLTLSCCTACVDSRDLGTLSSPLGVFVNSVSVVSSDVVLYCTLSSLVMALPA